MSEQTITDLNEVREGDLCTVEIEGRQYTGPAYAGGGGILLWGEYPLRYNNNMSSTYITFISATRTIPALPTELGSVIFIHEALGESFDPPVPAVRNGSDSFSWGVSRRIGFPLWLDDADITQWQECDVTPRGEVIPND